jgi:hypothetical protein
MAAETTVVTILQQVLASQPIGPVDLDSDLLLHATGMGLQEDDL